MPRIFLSRAAALLLGLLPVLANAAATPTVGTVPVQRLPAATSVSSTPVADETRGWLSAMGGYAARGDASLKVKGFGGYVGGDSTLFGLRARYYEGFQSLRHGRELGLMIGQRFGPNRSLWAALGAARFEYERRDTAGNASDQKQGGSVPVEFVWAPHAEHFGIEFRAEANFSQNLPIYTIGIAAALGKP